MSGERLDRRRRLLLVLATTAATLAATGITMAAGTSNVSFKFTPSTVPKHRLEGGTLNVHAHSAFTRDTRTDRIRFNFDDHFRFAPSSVPASCNPFDVSVNIDMAEAMARCGSAKIGTGTVQLTHGTETYNGCVLAFNRTPPSHLPRVLLFMVVEFGSSTTIDCSNPRSNHNGNSTVLLQGILRRGETRPDYRVQLDLNHISQATPFPITDLDLRLQRGHYISAHCGTEDFLRGWQLRTRLRSVNPSSFQKVDSTQRCAPAHRALQAGLQG
jgi:hypothetical protein